MKKIILCSSVFLCLAFAQGHADEHFPFLGEASRESVHIRAGANINFESLGKLNKGGQVVVTGRHYEWYEVQLPAAASAYVRADYVKDMGNATGTIMADKVNVRARADSESSSLGQMNKGDLVKLVEQLPPPQGGAEQVNGWWKIKPPASAEGWVRADLIIPAPPPPVPAAGGAGVAAKP
ncbi:MAG: SH3 domain-containing protein [Candidatus Omnitrophica bacterium]|nr:SH3 domain-containing protein [Candidatus Omnitrophota bacterium]